MRLLLFATALLLLLLASVIDAKPSCRTCRELLGLDDTALPSDIKKAYHQKALENHPDKNPDDPTAQERFLRIGLCYESLTKNKCSG
jgi:DnaJ-class molecular chaperone